MANEEHKKLAEFIKNTHLKLRKTTAALGIETAWKEHCEDRENLAKYAESMQKLATKYWQNNSLKETKMLTSRITWAVEIIKEYFSNEIYLTYRNREEDIKNKINNNLMCSYFDKKSSLRLLDVGSCYNPFSSYNCLDVLAIDLAPANPTVLKSDFLKLKIGQENIIEGENVIQLKENSYDIITFCFLLEYLPSSQQRILACKKAYSLLQYEGILIICTPDSKHVGSNAKIMKNWRWTLALLGFYRFRYEKFTHMHCMAFRKCINVDISRRWADLHKRDDFVFEIAIPQDSNIIISKDETVIERDKDETTLDFSSLPDSNVFE